MRIINCIPLIIRWTNIVQLNIGLFIGLVYYNNWRGKYGQAMCYIYTAFANVIFSHWFLLLHNDLL